MIDLMNLTKKAEPTSEEDFYAVVSAIAQFIEKVDMEENSYGS